MRRGKQRRRRARGAARQTRDCPTEPWGRAFPHRKVQRPFDITWAVDHPRLLGIGAFVHLVGLGRKHGQGGHSKSKVVLRAEETLGTKKEQGQELIGQRLRGQSHPEKYVPRDGAIWRWAFDFP